MFRWMLSLLLVLSGFLTSLFMERDALKFSTVQMVVAVLLFTLFIIILAFWPSLKKWFLSIIKKNKR